MIVLLFFLARKFLTLSSVQWQKVSCEHHLYPKSILNMADDQQEEEYKVLADELKDQGNQAFQAGDIQTAINFFTQAIDLDPDNHVYYSNRAAAYMKADSKSKALHDAEKCVELAPSWSKGYCRLGAAQQSLKRFDAAMDNFKKGIELEPNNKAHWASLKSCQEAYEADKKIRFGAAQLEREVEEKRLKQRETVKKELEEERLRRLEEDQKDALLSGFFSEVVKTTTTSSSDGPSTSATDGATIDTEPQAKNDAEEDNLLADFFSAVTAPTPTLSSANTSTSGLAPQAGKSNSTDAPTSPSSSSGAGIGATGSIENKRDETVLTDKYTIQDLGDGREQVERLLAKHYEWRNLNPYAVFQLGADATEEDIKLRYKKLSLKVHPDRLRDVENARLAFEQVNVGIFFNENCAIIFHNLHTCILLLYYLLHSRL